MKELIIFSLSIFLISHSSNGKKTEIGLFNNCGVSEKNIETVTITNQLFDIQYPSDWNIDNELKQGVDISSRNFPDSIERGFMLSVVPFQDFYFKENKMIKYYRFEKGEYNGYEAIFLTRNDLGIKEDSTVYWRNELKVKKGDNLYQLVFGLRNKAKVEPEWCDFKGIINSLIIK